MPWNNQFSEPLLCNLTNVFYLLTTGDAISELNWILFIWLVSTTRCLRFLQGRTEKILAYVSWNYSTFLYLARWQTSHTLKHPLQRTLLRKSTEAGRHKVVYIMVWDKADIHYCIWPSTFSDVAVYIHVTLPVWLHTSVTLHPTWLFNVTKEPVRRKRETLC